MNKVGKSHRDAAGTGCLVSSCRTGLRRRAERLRRKPRLARHPGFYWHSENASADSRSDDACTHADSRPDYNGHSPPDPTADHHSDGTAAAGARNLAERREPGLEGSHCDGASEHHREL